MDKENLEKKSLHQLKEELRQLNAPTVWRTKRTDGTVFLVIVYQDREETYELKRSDSFKTIREEEIEYDRYKAEELCKNSGGRQIHYQTKED